MVIKTPYKRRISNKHAKKEPSSSLYCFEDKYTWPSFTPLLPGGNKSSYVLKQTCSWELQVYLSMYDLLLTPDIKELVC